MKFSADINLHDRSSVAVVSSLWNREDIVADVMSLFVRRFYVDWFKERWVNITEKVMLHLRNLILPVDLKLNLENLVNLMGCQLFDWLYLPTSLCRQTFSDPPTSLRFYWTERGTLDPVKTARFMIDHCANIGVNFRLASFHSIEDIIYKLWPNIQQNKSGGKRKYLIFHQIFPLSFWIFHLLEDIDFFIDVSKSKYKDNTDTYEFAFLNVQDLKCTSSLRYFLELVEPERKKKAVQSALKSFFRHRYGEGNLLLFLFSYLEESEISQIISENTYKVLTSLLEWPCQRFFMPVVQSHWSHLSSLDYINLFEDILESLSSAHGDIYKNLAREFWQTSPLPHREYVISKCVSGTLASRLFLRRNTYELIQIVFRDISQRDRLWIVCHFEGANLCDLLVRKQKWDYLKLLITSCIPTLEDLELFILHYESMKVSYNTQEREQRTDVLKQKIKEWYKRSILYDS